MGKVAPDGAEQAADRGLSLSNKSHPSWKQIDTIPRIHDKNPGHCHQVH
jgi:hypothetical protein